MMGQADKFDDGGEKTKQPPTPPNVLAVIQVQNKDNWYSRSFYISLSLVLLSTEGACAIGSHLKAS